VLHFATRVRPNHPVVRPFGEDLHALACRSLGHTAIDASPAKAVKLLITLYVVNNTYVAGS